MTKSQKLTCSALFAGLIASVPAVLSQDNGSRVSSYMPVDIHEAFASIMARMSAAKPEIMRRQKTLLGQGYDVGNHAAQGVSMPRGKPVQRGGPKENADLVAFLAGPIREEV